MEEVKQHNGKFQKGHKGYKPIGSKSKEKNIDLRQMYEDLIGTFKSGKFYVYYHIDANTKEVIYIGKGNNNRAWDFRDTSRNENWNNYKNNHNIDVKIIASNLSQEESLSIEKALIETINPILNIMSNNVLK